ncbi:hypothetical protein ACTWPT_56305 [Nonomuraea sp. 3N208]|uniref:hypothetical protein n=1 Tax=Nonomuraea sp. 3N208 TaxID=3457421 RepID=UPI003FD32264
MAGITLLGALPASAASDWHSAPPTDATSVGTVTEKKVNFGGTFTIQLRVGKYGTSNYFWARAPKDSDARSKLLFLSVYNPSTKKWESSPYKIISNTSYTNAYRSRHKYGYRACVKTGSSPAQCTSTWWV